MTIGPFDDCIEDASVDVEVTRYEAAVVDHGRVEEPAVERMFCIRASMQPATSKDLRLLPEGMRNAGVMVAFTTCELYTARQSEGKIPDRLTYRGVVYQIHSVDDWEDLGGYHRYVVIRMNR